MPTKKLLLILVGLALLCYLPFVKNQLVWDDEQFIYSNAYVRNFAIDKIFTTSTTSGAGSVSNYYRPLTTLSFAIDYQFWGVNPIGYHISNLLLHLLAGILLFYLLLLLKLPHSASFWLSVLFIIHPLQTEAVVYANSRGDSLYSVFALLAALCFVYFYQRKSLIVQIYNQKLQLSPTALGLFSLVSYVLSILSKEIGIATLGIIVLIFLQQVLTRSRDNLKRNLLLLLSFGVLAAGYLWLRATILNFDNSFDFYADGSLYSQSLIVRLLTFSKILLIYGRLLFIPYPLHMERSTDIVTSLFSFFPWITLSLCGVLTWLGWKEFRQTKQVWIWFGLGWFSALLLPVSGIIPINGMLYEHWLYLPMIGLFLCLYGVFRNNKFLHTHSQTFQYVLFTFSSVLILLTWRQNYIWGTPIRFYTYLLQHTQSARIHNNLAMAYAENQQLDQALLEYQKSLKISQSYPQTYYNIANLYLTIGDYDNALINLEQALQLAPNFEPAKQTYAALLEASASGKLKKVAN